jgi:hemoglobin
MTKKQYGDGDTSFQTAGGEEGVRKLVWDFYSIMSELPQAKKIRDMHPEDIDVSKDKLARFLCGWLGGPKLFREKYGPIQIPRAHHHLDIGVDERDAWLECMKQALVIQPYPESFKEYLLSELFKPADRSRSRD